MTKDTLLLIEDEKNITELIRYHFEKEGFRVLASAKGNAGLEMARRERPSLILLDLMLPEISGLEICKILKQNVKTAAIPIIMLTAKGEEADKVVGLEIGADDYVTKPFSPRELVARVKAVLRRAEEEPADEVLKAGALEVDTARHVVTLKKKLVELTPKEYDLLKTLLEAKGRVLTREFLLNKVWGYDESLHIETRTIDMHVGQLRKKIKSEADRIVTVKSAGYRFDHDEK